MIDVEGEGSRRSRFEVTSFSSLHLHLRVVKEPNYPRVKPIIRPSFDVLYCTLLRILDG